VRKLGIRVDCRSAQAILSFQPAMVAGDEKDRPMPNEDDIKAAKEHLAVLKEIAELALAMPNEDDIKDAKEHLTVLKEIAEIQEAVGAPGYEGLVRVQ
jgi:hypothetical protein